jgi:hypothetical protein
MDKIPAKIIIITIFTLFSLFLLSYINALNNGRNPWNFIIICLDAITFTSIVVMLIIVSFFGFKLMLTTAKLGERCIINIFIISICLILFILFSFISYLLHGEITNQLRIHQKYESLLAIIIFGLILCATIAIGSVCIIITALVNGCYTSYLYIFDDSYYYNKRYRGEEV